MNEHLNTKQRKFFSLLLVSVLTLMFITSCSTAEVLDKTWEERAQYNPAEQIEEYFNFLYLIPVFAVYYIAKAINRSPYPDWVSMIHWLFISALGVGTILYVSELINVLSVGTWPEEYTLATVMAWMGWELPWPEGNIWTAFFGYAVTVFIPTVYALWKTGLLAIHALILMLIAFTRRTKLIIIELVFIFCTILIPSFLVIGTLVTSELMDISPDFVKPAIEGLLYPVGVAGTFVCIGALLPLLVTIILIFIPFGRYAHWQSDSEEKAKKKQPVAKESLEEGFTRIDEGRSETVLERIFSFFGSFFVKPKPPHENNDSQSDEDNVFLIPPRDDGVDDYVDGDSRPDDNDPSGLGGSSWESGYNGDSQEEDSAYEGSEEKKDFQGKRFTSQDADDFFNEQDRLPRGGSEDLVDPYDPDLDLGDEDEEESRSSRFKRGASGTVGRVSRAGSSFASNEGSAFGMVALGNALDRGSQESEEAGNEVSTRSEDSEDSSEGLVKNPSYYSPTRSELDPTQMGSVSEGRKLERVTGQGFGESSESRIRDEYELLEEEDPTFPQAQEVKSQGSSTAHGDLNVESLEYEDPTFPQAKGLRDDDEYLSEDFPKG